MKAINSQVLLDTLMADTRQLILEANKLQHLPAALLQVSPAPGKWSVAQVLEHLNFYSSFYLKAIEEKLHHHQASANSIFKPGWLGNYFTNMMKPTDACTVKNKMKAMKSATPMPQVDAKAALVQFITDQHTLLNLLQIARTADLNRLRVPTSLSKMLTFKLGDTFRFFIAHEQRHRVQWENVLKELMKAEMALGE
jgi:uncharacterized damage-inducible protein DinB